MATTITPKSRPSTPAPAPAAAQGKPNLSTPTSLGTSTAAHSDALPDLTVRTTYPLLHKDIEDHEQCGFVPMLTEFLKRCRPEGPKANDSDLLDKCLDAVLPICNSDSVKKGIKD
ncbi:hypothetical protein H0H81_003655 [Sphagnurus paluster]|uniref:Uncharacterized protein n=1 Tax=Sphagnurus paluster TaxID=117069 RepID=A0A9P7KES7_9AGAR|nr:hypothetical protein H0H81_003655 [Sphagnurus paluster]